MKTLSNKKLNNGITLIALVITIIVLLILAGVSIATLTGENGILTQAEDAKEINREAEAIEKVKLEVAGSYSLNGNLDKESLQKNLNNIKGVEGITITDFPVIITVDEYKFKIKKSGEVEKIQYVEVEYIESDGNQYINTEFIADLNTVAKYKYMPIQSANNGYFQNIVSGNYFLYPVLRIDGFHCLQGANKGYHITSKGSYGNIYEIEAFNNSKAYINGEEYLIDSGNYTTDINNIYLFTAGVNPGYYNYKNVARLYYCQLYRNGELIRDYIPVLDKDEKACLFDKVEGKFYYNSGTGEFSYGKIIE